MKEETINRAIMEVCGVVECDNWHPFIAGASMMKNDDSCGHNNCVPRGMITNYYGSLDAMHEAEKVLNLEQQQEYWLRLCRDIVPLSFNAWHATAAQRSEAFLRTLNLWKEE